MISETLGQVFHFHYIKNERKNNMGNGLLTINNDVVTEARNILNALSDLKEYMHSANGSSTHFDVVVNDAGRSHLTIFDKHIVKDGYDTGFWVHYIYQNGEVEQRFIERDGTVASLFDENGEAGNGETIDDVAIALGDDKYVDE